MLFRDKQSYKTKPMVDHYLYYMVLLGISAIGDHTHFRSDHSWYICDMVVLGISAMGDLTCLRGDHA